MLDSPVINLQTRFKTGATLLFAQIPSPGSMLIKVTKSFSQFSLLPDFFGFRRGIGPSSPRILWIVPTSLPRSQFFLFSYPCKIKRKENYFCSTCKHLLQNLTYSLLDCSASKLLRRAIFGTGFNFWFLFQTSECGPIVRSPRNSSAPSSLVRGQVAPSPPHYDSNGLLAVFQFASVVTSTMKLHFFVLCHCQRIICYFLPMTLYCVVRSDPFKSCFFGNGNSVFDLSCSKKHTWKSLSHYLKHRRINLSKYSFFKWNSFPYPGKKGKKDLSILKSITFLVYSIARLRKRLYSKPLPSPPSCFCFQSHVKPFLRFVATTKKFIEFDKVLRTFLIIINNFYFC